MAMNGVTLGDAMLVAVNAVTGGSVTPDRTAIFRAMGSAIVAHIQTFATTTAAVTTADVTACPAGPGTGTGSGTATGTAPGAVM